MRALIVFVQVLISAVLTASLMPVVLVTVPAAQDDRTGLAIVSGLFVVSFLGILLVWPKRAKR